jgi:hypothetical protein
MTQEDKNLLLKDLVGRLPYGVKVQMLIWDYNDKITTEEDATLYSVNMYGYCETVEYDAKISVEEITPYLFPLDKISGDMWSEYLATCVGGNASFPTLKSFEWCNENHIDFRGLIPKGLALDATGLNIY